MKPFDSIAAPILAAYPALEAADLDFAPSPKLDVGDVALRTFLAAKKLKMAPPAFAAAVAKDVRFDGGVISATPAGPYLNFRLDRSAFARGMVAGMLREGAKFGSNAMGAGQKLLIEHTSINPNASPHVGRARNAMFGDSLTRLFRFEGYTADVHYYVNDIGRQIGLLVLHVNDFDAMSFDQILDAYVAANARAESDPEFAKQGYDLLAKMEEGDPETAKRFYQITEKCLRGQLAVLGRLGIAYDQFDRESKYLKHERLNVVLEALRAKSAVFTDEEERLVVDLAKLGWEREEGRFFVLMRANGSSMYGFRDLAYTMDKMSKGADVNLWVLGEDHKLYAEQLTLILKSAGQPVPEPIYYAHILLREGRMSTRQGKVVLLSDFLDEATARAREKVDEQCKDLSDAERGAIAEKVAIAAVRFAILRVNPNKNVIFDWESSLSFAGDTGPYVQYSCARIHSMLRKFGAPAGEPGTDFVLDHDSEWLLLTKLAEFPDVVASAAATRNVAPIGQFVLDAARQFTTFYHDCPVLTADSDARKRARIQLCAATLQTFTNALGILGIEALERM
jgi:arginyl-tRNA synthetase